MLFKLKVVNHLGLRSSFTALRVIKCFTALKLQVFLIILLILSCRKDLCHFVCMYTSSQLHKKILLKGFFEEAASQQLMLINQFLSINDHSML